MRREMMAMQEQYVKEKETLQHEKQRIEVIVFHKPISNIFLALSSSQKFNPERH